ncbi:MAG: hypothetical protein DMF06_05050 [Verrucomicrobia bacterium]|nr:MAG: hypothetical protein DMF06_05050 [Verrucomicrobiota bacterium]
MNGPYVDAAITAEIKRSWRDNRPIDRRFLRHETGLAGDRLEGAISRSVLKLASEIARQLQRK